ncbi:12690_t:CDS:2 [Entrophospora sp. SA101]|nr:12690_t:CDS:2 [Entrophospora sp. SA101]
MASAVSLLDSGSTEIINPDIYFQIHFPPKNLKENENKIQEFVDKHQKKGRRVVLVTSGGTTVPLENNTVRFLDNFSAGSREDYAVIFMHRQFSLQPYSRHYTHASSNFLDLLELKDDGSVVDFVTVTDYLFLLRSATQIMNKLKENAMYYLAAAVSDFFIPVQKVSQHKIQSGEGALTLKMDQVPKFLKPMVTNWAPEGFIVSFKLETDPSLLVEKARKALTRYGHQIVIANLLMTRKTEIIPEL